MTEADVIRVRGVVLPEGEHRDVYVVHGRVTYDVPSGGASTVAEGWIVPGLVDAHCHVGLGEHGGIPEDVQEQQATSDRDAGALLLRDCGSPSDTRWIQERDNLPRLIRAGRFLARPKRYMRNFAHEIEPEELPAYMKQEARRGDGWVKLVGDWIDRDIGDLAPCWPRAALEEGIAAAHEHGARVTAHVFGEDALPDLIGAGIDCIEHGTGLGPDLIATMAERRVALVPTAWQLNNFPKYAEQAGEKFPEYSRHMLALFEQRKQTIAAAYEAGVPMYAGSDAGAVLPHGLIGEEIAELVRHGMSAYDALGAASWRAREWLGHNPTLEEGAPADLVVYPADPTLDVGVLREPSRVILRGRVVR
ncbi:MAG: amidohydrolase family protein [Propionibacteriales bacterium]|nr:amidohydrolase family protein [Propionibacteriales bacterium]